VFPIRKHETLSIAFSQPSLQNCEVRIRDNTEKYKNKHQSRFLDPLRPRGASIILLSSTAGVPSASGEWYCFFPWLDEPLSTGPLELVSFPLPQCPESLSAIA